ncbi:MAG: hypothetical protein V1921_05160 [Candidatus Altiarchaeota archaeon]
MCQNIIDKIEGTGKLSTREGDSEGQFEVIRYIDKPLKVHFHEKEGDSSLPDALNGLFHELPEKASLEGILSDGRRIKINELYLTSKGGLKRGKPLPKIYNAYFMTIDRDSKDSDEQKLEFLVSNFVFTGCDYTKHSDGVTRLDRFTISLEGYEFTFQHIQNYEDIVKCLKRKDNPFAITARIVVKARFDEFEHLSEIVKNICILLSLAMGNSIVPLIERKIDGEKVIGENSYIRRVDRYNGLDSLIREHPTEEIKEFVEQTYEDYLKYKDSFNLPVIIDYYLLMKTGSIMDIRCLFGFILLECLSSKAQQYYEKNGNPIVASLTKSNIKKLNEILPSSHNLGEETIRKIAEEVGYSYPTLPDSINKLMGDFGMEYKQGEQELYGLRKHFIHRGMYPDDTKEHLEINHRLIHFIDRLLLHILGYQGGYLNIADDYKYEEIRGVN